MPKTKSVQRVVKYQTNPTYPAGPFEVLKRSLDRECIFETNVFDLGDEIFELIQPEFQGAGGEYVYDNRVIVRVLRDKYFCVTRVTIRFASSKIAERLLGPSKCKKARQKETVCKVVYVSDGGEIK
jgi:hypothetical protein